MEPYLLIHSNTGAEVFSLADGTAWSVGRGEENAVVLNDSWVSRNHAILQITDSGNFCLIDLGSLNGSYVNGKRVSIPVALHNSDRLTFGETHAEIFCEEVKEVVVNPQPQRWTIPLQKQRMITVLVIDIRNFTGLTQNLEEEMLSRVIGTWFSKATEIISHYGSWVDKYIGDAVMAVWVHEGIKNSGETLIKVAPSEMVQVFQALHALYLMSDQLNQQFELPMRLRIGAGINSGNAMIGQVGTGHRPEYTVLGDTVNVAFRLESSTKELDLDIAIGESTYHFCPQASTCLPFKPYTVTLKGYSNPTNTYAGTFADLKTFLNQVKVGYL